MLTLYANGMVTITDGWDATHENLPTAPAGQGAGYTTGSPDIRWTDEDWADHAGAVRICQDAAASDETADALDIEQDAATIEEAPRWYRRARANYEAGTRPGQREPCFYFSMNTMAGLLGRLKAAGIDSGPKLWLARPGIARAVAVHDMQDQAAAFPIVAEQIRWERTFDADVYAENWLAAVSVSMPAPPPPVPPTWTELLLMELPTLKLGEKSGAVRTAQGLLLARHYHLGDTGALHDGLDGDFGKLTDSAVRDLQGKAGIKPDGIVGPKTWPVLAGV